LNSETDGESYPSSAIKLGLRTDGLEDLVSASKP
jgi:hypothetical protein